MPKKKVRPPRGAKLTMGDIIPSIVRGMQLERRLGDNTGEAFNLVSGARAGHPEMSQQFAEMTESPGLTMHELTGTQRYLQGKELARAMGVPLATLANMVYTGDKALSQWLGRKKRFIPIDDVTLDETTSQASLANLLAAQAGIASHWLPESQAKPIKSYQEGTMPMRTKAEYVPGQATAYQSPYVVPPAGGVEGFGYMAGLLERQMKLKEAMMRAQLQMMQQQRLAAEQQLAQAKQRALRETSLWRKQMAPEAPFSGRRAPEQTMPTLQDWQMMSDPRNVDMPGREGAFNRVFGWLGPQAIAQMQMQKGKNWADVIAQGSASAATMQSGQPQMIMNQGTAAPTGVPLYTGEPGYRFGVRNVGQGVGGPIGQVPIGQTAANLAMAYNTWPTRQFTYQPAPIGGLSAEKGGRVPKTGTYKLHKGEIVLNKKQSDMMFPKPSKGKPIASYQAGTLEEEIRRAEEELRRLRGLYPQPFRGGPPPGATTLAGPGTAEDIIPGAFSQRSGGSVWEPDLTGMPTGTRYRSVPQEMALAAQGRRFYGAGAASRTGSELVVSSPESLARYMGQLERSATGAEAETLAGARKWLLTAGKKAGPEVADDLAKWTTRLGRAGRLGVVGAGVLGAAAAAWWGISQLATPSSEAAQRETTADFLKNFQPSTAAAAPTVSSFGEVLHPRQPPEFVGRQLGPSPIEQQASTSAFLKGFQPPAPQAQPIQAGDIGDIPGLTITEDPISERRMISAFGRQIPSRPETTQQTVKKYTLTGKPETDKERATRLRTQADHWARNADYYQQKADALLNYVGSMDRPNPEVMKLLRDRQTVADRYKKREEKAIAEADKIEERQTQAETKKEIARVEQETVMGREKILGGLQAREAQMKAATALAENLDVLYEEYGETGDQVDFVKRAMTFASPHFADIARNMGMSYQDAKDTVQMALEREIKEYADPGQEYKPGMWISIIPAMIQGGQRFAESIG